MNSCMEKAWSDCVALAEVLSVNLYIMGTDADSVFRTRSNGSSTELYPINDHCTRVRSRECPCSRKPA